MKKELKFMLLGIYIAVIGMVCLIAATHSIDGFGFFEVAGVALPAVSLLIFIRGFTSDFKKDQ